MRGRSLVIGLSGVHVDLGGLDSHLELFDTTEILERTDCTVCGDSAALLVEQDLNLVFTGQVAEGGDYVAEGGLACVDEARQLLGGEEVMEMAG